MEQQKIRKGRGRDITRKNADGTPHRPSPESAANARPNKVFITHTGRAREKLLSNPLDLRSTLGKRYAADVVAFKAHVGGDLTVTQAKLIDQASRLGLLVDIAWSEVMAAETLVKDNTPSAAVDTFLKAARDHRAVLGLLGLERRARNVTLQDVLEARETGHAPT